MERVFSGIKPSGELHLGNYLGAIRNFVDLQNTAECIFSVVDLHALTVPQEPDDLHRRTLDIARLYVACGIDPAKATIFVQSHVSAHAELGWLLGCFTYFGELRRMTQFKEKSEGQVNVSSGLFTYPVLMAADILLYNADKVPVGEDQKQHLELTRDIAQRINNRFGEIFKVPEPYIPPKSAGGRIMSLDDPLRKMGKSEDPKGTIALLDPPDVIAKKIRSAVTDSGSEVRRGPGKEGISNLIEILAVVRGVEPEAIEREFEGSGYGDFKRAVAEAVIEYLAPVRERYAQLRGDEAELERVLALGAEKARAIASEVVAEVRDAMGIGPARAR